MLRNLDKVMRIRLSTKFKLKITMILTILIYVILFYSILILA